ncbi:MAG: hypothetical protein PHD21_02070, partial [Flavobacteriales bacterium]|nr:hypothetical protein [Flavobacteriales bacterium]
PDFVNRMAKEQAARCSCDHTNYCIARMYTLEMACHRKMKDLPCCIIKELNQIRERETKNATKITKK